MKKRLVNFFWVLCEVIVLGSNTCITMWLMCSGIVLVFSVSSVMNSQISCFSTWSTFESPFECTQQSGQGSNLTWPVGSLNRPDRTHQWRNSFDNQRNHGSPDCGINRKRKSQVLPLPNPPLHCEILCWIDVTRNYFVCWLVLDSRGRHDQPFVYKIYSRRRSCKI